VADVVVLGCGLAGAAAALAARRAGAEVVILEKSSPDAHTPNVRMSGGWIMSVTDVRAGATYLSAVSAGLVDESLFTPWAERAMNLRRDLSEWEVELTLADTATWGFANHGPAMWAEHHSLPGAEAIRAWRPSTQLPAPYPGRGPQARAVGEVAGGEALYRGYMAALAKSGVQVRWEADPFALLTEDGMAAGRITGIEYRHRDGFTEPLGAGRGVVIATGGFGASPELVREFLPVPNTRFYGNPQNDGGGLRLAMSAGADLVRMNRMVGRAIGSFEVPGGQTVGFTMVLPGGGYVLTDQLGRRYANEFDLAQQHHSFYLHMLEFDEERMRYVRSPSYWLFDERRRRAGPLTPATIGACALGMYDWSEDNQREIDAGWIGMGATPAAAAHAAGAEPGCDFDVTVESYNEACRAGLDALGRPAESLVPLDQPPYYCMPLYIGGPYTNGGPRRDALGRVISVRREPIPGLYCAGELGQAVGLGYPGVGASLSEAFCLGQLTGESAAAGL
jgi:succinate dehydrogenase/fumarate reductase flavoprotein subunit